MKFIYLLSAGLFSFILISAVIFDDPLAKLLSNLKSVAESFPQEKVHLHLDKPYYTAGDNIWFKAYVLEEHSLSPTDRSGVLYVDLIHGGSVLSSLKLPIENGVTSGDFKLSDSISEGNYRIRAYTRWMRNSSESFFFDKTISIGNKIASRVAVSSVWNSVGTGKSSNLEGRLIFKNLDSLPYADMQLTVQLKAADKILKTATGTTNGKGEFKVSFERPDKVHGALTILAILSLNGRDKVTKVFPVPSGSDGFNVQFSPEGGRIVKGLPCKVAVRVSNRSNSGLTVAGKVWGKSGEIVNFTTNSLGLGSFILKPPSSDPQKVEITFENGVRKEYDLPKIEDDGYALMLRNNSTLQVFISEGLLNKGALRVVGQRNGNVYFVKDVPSTKQLVNVVVPSAQLPSGILQLSLFGQDTIPICERFMFINNEQHNIVLSHQGLKQVYAKRSPVELQIEATQQGLPVEGSFSVSVTQTSVVVPDLESETNIFTSFLLSTDSNDEINKPNSYLKKEALQDLDLLLLTGSWRNIPWKSLMEKTNQKVAFEVENRMAVSGTLTNNGKPVPKGKVTLIKSKQGFEMLGTTSDLKGRFRFDSLSFSDSTKLLLQARTASDKKNMKILIDLSEAQPLGILEKPDSYFYDNVKLGGYINQSEAYFNSISNWSGNNEVTKLNEVEIVGERKTRETFVKMHGKPDVEFGSKQLDTTAFLTQLLSGKIRGKYRDYAILIDGQWLTDQYEIEHFFTSTEPSSLEKIEVLSSPHLSAAYLSRKPILVVTTKKISNYKKISYAPGMTTLTPRGFSYRRVFSSPDHSKDTGSKPDLRTTVYWNPNLAVEADGKIKIHYFNTDRPGQYRIVIEGVGGNGALARKEIYYEVK